MLRGTPCTQTNFSHLNAQLELIFILEYKQTLQLLERVDLGVGVISLFGDYDKFIIAIVDVFRTHFLCLLHLLKRHCEPFKTYSFLCRSQG